MSIRYLADSPHCCVPCKIQLKRIVRALELYAPPIVTRISRVVWSMIGVQLLLMTIYSIFGVAGIHWSRVIGDFESGESFARCRIGQGKLVIIPLLCLAVSLSIINLMIAFKAKSDNEAWWIYTFIVVQIEVSLKLVVNRREEWLFEDSASKQSCSFVELCSRLLSFAYRWC